MTARWTPVDRVVVAVVVVAVVASAWVAGGRGYLNGDAAAYAAQAWDGDLGQRGVHLGWIGLATALAPLAGDALPAWLDRLNALFAACVPIAVAAWSLLRGGRPWVGALGAAAAVLAWAPFAEVDLPWVALATLAVVVRAEVAAGLLFALAVTFSPLALLAAPWVGLARREAHGLDWTGALRPVALGGALAVLGLTVATAGAWWVGDRGLLATPPPDPLRAVRAWTGNLPVGLIPLAGVAAFAAARSGPGPRPPGRVVLLAALALLAGPADTPAFLPLAATIATSAAVGWEVVPSGGRSLAAVVLLVQLSQSGLQTAYRALWVGEQDRVCRSVAEALGPDDGLVAPFTWGARVSVLAARDPYALRWRPSTAPLRDQGARWCSRPVARVAVLPPGVHLGAGEADAYGVWWTRGDDPALAGWCGPAAADSEGPAPGARSPGSEGSP